MMGRLDFAASQPYNAARSAGGGSVEPVHDERRLTTILAADVVGYSRLMGEDEAATLAALKAQPTELFDPKAAQYNVAVLGR